MALGLARCAVFARDAGHRLAPHAGGARGEVALQCAFLCCWLATLLECNALAQVKLGRGRVRGWFLLELIIKILWIKPFVLFKLFGSFGLCTGRRRCQVRGSWTWSWGASGFPSLTVVAFVLHPQFRFLLH